jgi:hypothetical protein
MMTELISNLSEEFLPAVTKLHELQARYNAIELNGDLEAS